MKYNKMLTYALIPAMLGIGVLGANVAAAHGMFGFGMASTLTPDEIATRQQDMFQNEAQILGLTVDQVKEAWSQGKTMQQIIQDYKLDATQIQTHLKDAAIAKQKAQLQTLVDKNIITQAQADARSTVMQNRMTNGKGRMGKSMMRGEWF
ncbi:MAG: helix-turn-helix domain-containing protein [Candidatus Komeilibacteria bacterium]